MLPCGLVHLFGCVARQILEFSEELFHWIEIAAVWRQEDEVGAGLAAMLRKSA